MNRTLVLLFALALLVAIVAVEAQYGGGYALRAYGRHGGGGRRWGRRFVRNFGRGFRRGLGIGWRLIRG